ncbi:ABC transporter ATP-binding protein [Consotaella salsifontis]|uniref:Peptide/nickel transport system ATP-binding protein n=1 Tax=Consotaella salsifontis TaxID=1365950 RepID=A0A1T4SP86_9HYPH|nr:ABC transporter ATP-binding protein [Consotaella salsifontis]SKA29977.1 peptide/nickel transport system ATP-binding protein [Consotaella salsifontis]
MSVTGEPSEAPPVLSIEGLRTHFETDRGNVRSVDGVDLSIRRGETLAIVGESGSGKSVTSLSIMRLIGQPGRIAGGSMIFAGDGGALDLATATETQMRRLWGNQIGMIFQEPMTSLNPVQRAGDQIAEAIMLHQNKGRAAAREAAVAMLRRVGIPAPERRARDYPHQMSGGMRQRVMIAMALCCRPKLLIADEPTTALDVTIQAQILKLMKELQEEIGMAVLFITHDLAVVAEVADKVAVMYAGRIVESGDVDTVFAHPRHPYTKALLESVPRPGHGMIDEKGRRRLHAIQGTVPNLLRLPPGCSFAPRCGYAIEACRAGVPSLMPTDSEAHRARCIRWEVV